MKLPEIKFKNVIRARVERDAYPMHEITQYSMGFGRVGKGFNTRSTEPPKFRTFIRIRSSVGICSYVYRTHPNKGKIIPFCRYYTLVKEISREKTIELIGKNKVEKLE